MKKIGTFLVYKAAFPFVYAIEYIVRHAILRIIVYIFLISILYGVSGLTLFEWKYWVGVTALLLLMIMEYEKGRLDEQKSQEGLEAEMQKYVEEQGKEVAELIQKSLLGKKRTN